MAKQGEAAYAYFLKGYNCSQSVVAAFAPQLGLSEEMALRMSAGFGAGIGRMREVCGAFCGVVTVLSLVYADPADPADKSRMYALVQEAARLYRARNGGDSIICRELLAKAGAAPSSGTKAEARTADYYKKRPCPELCRMCADLCAVDYLLAAERRRPDGVHGERFEVVDRFATSAGTDAASFTADGARYLVVANSLNASLRFRADSVVYRIAPR